MSGAEEVTPESPAGDVEEAVAAAAAKGKGKVVVADDEPAARPAGDDEEEDDEEDDFQAGAGPLSSALKKRQRSEGEGEGPEVIAGLSGDEVDPSLIIPGGRRSRRGRPSGSLPAQPKYQAAAALDSDEDEW